MLKKFKDNLTNEALEYRKKIKDAVKKILDGCKTHNLCFYATSVRNDMKDLFKLLDIKVKVNDSMIQSQDLKKQQKELIRIWKKAKKYVSPKKYIEVVTEINNTFNKFNNPN